MNRATALCNIKIYWQTSVITYCQILYICDCDFRGESTGRNCVKRGLIMSAKINKKHLPVLNVINTANINLEIARTRRQNIRGSVQNMGSITRSIMKWMSQQLFWPRLLATPTKTQRDLLAKMLQKKLLLFFVATSMSAWRLTESVHPAGMSLDACIIL